MKMQVKRRKSEILGVAEWGGGVVRCVLGCVAALALLAGPALAQYPSTNYVVKVNPGATSPFDTWGTAATNIQDALNAAAGGALVLVSNGTYQLTSEIVITNSLTLRSTGGYTKTLIDGQDAVRCVQMKKGTLEGLTLTNGYATSSGGGIYMPFAGSWDGGCGGTVRDCVIVECVAAGTGATDGGGGIHSAPGTSATPDLNAQTATFEGVTIRNCRAAKFGGGFHGTYGTNILTDCTITDSEALADGGGARFIRTGYILDSVIAGCLATNNGNGGGIAGTFFLSGTTVSNCTAKRVSGTGETGNGGGVFGAGMITNCTIVNNTAINPRRGGGGLLLAGGDVYDSLVQGNQALLDDAGLSGTTAGGGGISKNNLNQVNLHAVRIIGNTSGYGGGGGCYFGYRGVLIDRCEITDNEATGQGGGINIGSLVSASAPSVTVRNTLIAHNRCSLDGGGVYAYMGSTSYTNFYESSTIVSNYATGNDGGGLYLNQCPDLILNSIVYDNLTPSGTADPDRDIDVNAGTITIAASCIESIVGLWNDGGDNLALGADPQFVSQAARNYRLKNTSPCIDEGSTQGWMSGDALDLDGNGRVAGSAVDMGAYEYYPSGTMISIR